mgnify:CR=1 FL=1
MHKEKRSYCAKVLTGKNRKHKWILGLAVVVFAASILCGLGNACYPPSRVKEEPPTSTHQIQIDSDGDGIVDVEEIKYGTDPYKPNFLLAYALQKVPPNEALKYFKEGKLDNDSQGLVDLYASLPQEKRASEEVNQLLAQILQDEEVDDNEKSLFNDKFVKPTPPRIENLSFRPTEERLDKVYAIEVNFTARDGETPISSAEVHFIPEDYSYMIKQYGMRPEDYPKVFPPEEERVFVVKPGDGEFDELVENFVVPIQDIVGGKEYKIRVLVRDSAGNESMVEMKTPYIREHENLGKVLHDNGIEVMAIYVPFDMSNIPKKHDDPLLGRYNLPNDIVIKKHVDWFTGHGGNIFILDSQNHWWSASPALKRKVLTIADKLISLNQIYVAWLVGPSKNDFIYGKFGEKIPEWAIDLNIPKNNQVFLEFVDELMREDILNHPYYLKIDGKPVLYIWDEGAFFNQENTYRAVKKLVEERTGKEAYIIAEWIPRIPTLPSDEYVQFLLQNYRGAGLGVVDAFTGWIGFHRVGLDTKEYVENYLSYYERHLPVWRNFTKKWGKDFILTVTPGFDHSYSWGEPQIPLPRDVEEFSKRLEIAIKYIDKRHPMLKIDTWNDWGEWSWIEPGQKEQLTYLKALRGTLENSFLNSGSTYP